MTLFARKRMVLRWLAPALFLSAAAALMANGDKADRIQSAFAKKLDAIQSHPDGFRRFCRQNPDLFPRDECSEWALVRKEKLQLLNGERVAVGAAYSQVLIPASMEQVIRYLETPRWFRELYDLDADAEIAHAGNAGDGCFQARIFKRVPLLPDQDFVLGFSRIRFEDVWFQRARLVEDRKQFAVRDNLKILVPWQNGVMYREISLVYPQRWWARALGPTFRKVMRRQVRQMLAVLRCVIPSGPEPQPGVARECWERSRRD